MGDLKKIVKQWVDALNEREVRYRQATEAQNQANDAAAKLEALRKQVCSERGEGKDKYVMFSHVDRPFVVRITATEVEVCAAERGDVS